MKFVLVVFKVVLAIFCRVGSYAPPGSDAACTQCPAGYTTVAMGSSSAASCSGKRNFERSVGHFSHGDNFSDTLEHYRKIWFSKGCL